MQPTSSALGLTLAKGLSTDSAEQAQPEHTYRHAENIAAAPDLSRESAPLPLDLRQLPGDVLGLGALNGEAIVFYRASGGRGGVGVLRHLSGAGVAPEFVPVWESALLQLAGPVKFRSRVDYRGHRLVYFTDGVNPVRKLDLDGPRATEADDLDLVLHNPLPALAAWELLDGGSLPAGMYQVLARLLTSSKVGTPFNVGTPLIPVSARPSTAPWNQQDGGLERPGARQLSVTVGSIPAGFRYVQLAVVTYDPYTLAPDVRLQPPVEIAPSQTEAQLLVSSLPDDQISVDALVTEALSLKTAADLTLAKESLLLYDVTLQQEDGFDWQAVANQVEVFWVQHKLTTVPALPQVTSSDETSPAGTVLPLYYDAATAAEYRALQTGEVYSLALSPIIEGERTQAAFHIPAGVAGSQPRATQVWTSRERYPVDRGFPLDAQGRPAFIRHHRMPDMREAPLTDNATPFDWQNNATAVNVLGLEVVLPANLDALIPASIRKRLTGFRVLRQPRPVAESTVLASGLAQPMLSYRGVLFPSPFSGYSRPVGTSAGTLDQGWTRINSGHPYHVEKKRLAFYSLDTILGGVDVSTAERLEYLGLLKGRVYGVRDKRDNDGNKEESGKFVETFVSVPQLDPTLTTTGPLPLDQGLTQPIGSGDEYAQDVNVGDPLGSYSVRNQNGYVLLGLGTVPGLPSNAGFRTAELRAEMEYSNRENRTDELFYVDEGGTFYNQDDVDDRLIPAQRYLTQLRRTLPSQYGRLEQASYLAVGELPAAAGARTRVFRGDVFVQPQAILLASQERRYNTDLASDDKNGVYTRQLVWFYAESRVNASKRHFDAPKGGNAGTLPYYPLYKSLHNDAGTGLLQLPVANGHAVGYNKVFSLEDRVTVFRPPLLAKDAIVERFRNRTYYSAPLVEGSLSDAWQGFRTNDYYDLPATHGHLTDVFELGGVLYQRTTGSLYRAYFKETTFQATSSGQAMLGTGLAFAQPSTELNGADDGYAGGTQAGSSNTPAGRILVDQERGQVFAFAGQLQELLRPNGCQQAFAELLASGPVTAGVYDPRPDRQTVYLFTGTRGLSYSLSGQQFLGFNAFGADHAVTVGSHVVLAKGNRLQSLTLGAPAPHATLDVVALPGGGVGSAVVFAGQVHGPVLPARIAFATEGQTVSATFRAHRGLRDVYRQPTEIVATPFASHFNYSLPLASNGTRLSGAFLRARLEWDQPMTLRLLTFALQAKGV